MTQPAQVAALRANAVQDYLKDIGRIPLLTFEQEVAYGQQIQRMVQHQKVYQALCQHQGEAPTLEDWATELELTVNELEAELKAGVLAKQAMVKANLRLVVSIAKKYQNNNLDLLDLIQEGAVGLQRGVEKFDPNRGHKFSTYAYCWIQQAVTRAITRNSRVIRLPINMVSVLQKIKRSQRQLSQQLGRVPTLAEIATDLNLHPKKVRQVLEAGQRPISLDHRVSNTNDTKLVDVLQAEVATPIEQLEKLALSQELKQVLDQLSPIMREILVLRFGLDGAEDLSLTQIAQQLGISREHARRLQHKACKIIRQDHSEIRHYLAS